MKIKLTKFGQTKWVKATPHNMREDEIPQKILWIEEEEDYYALLNAAYASHKIAIVRREDWLSAEEIA